MLSFLLDPVVGACAYGVSRIDGIPPEMMLKYETWLAEGNAAEMNYLHNHLPIRHNPRLLLDDAVCIISFAIPYSPAIRREKSLSAVATYAYGSDYHDVLRDRLSGAAERLKGIFGGEYRICIDSAPVFERYWAEKCGIGERCDNGLISVPGYGTRVFLAEILSTSELPLTKEIKPACHPQTNQAGKENNPELRKRGASVNPVSCLHCGACRKACPAGALQPDSTVDARRCLSYLTIEHRGDWDGVGESAMSTPAGRRTLFGCDICQDVCPLNSPLNQHIPPTGIEEFQPRPSILDLTAAQVEEMTQTDFSGIFKGSPIKRTKLAGLFRNAHNITDCRDT